jgi:hypothetical protein
MNNQTLIVFEMPHAIKIALPIDNNGLVDREALVLLRNQTWNIINSTNFIDDLK